MGWTLRLFAITMALLSLVACSRHAQGTANGAAEAAGDFLSLLMEGKANEAWMHLTPATRTVIYDDDEGAFAADVQQADWSRLEWEIGPITDYEISWGVNVIVDDEAVPDFLFREGLVTASDPFGMHLLVQLNDAGYMIAGRGLDTE
jgi:hypothetical protein